MKKVTLTFGLTLTLMLATNTSIFAQWDGNGSSADPYLIKTVTDLANLAYAVNTGYDNFSGKFFRLENDLDLNVPPYNTDKGWTPIGKYTDIEYPFSGNFNGNGKKISNLYVHSGARHQGVFGYANGATIENLGVENVDILYADHAGGVIGALVNSSVSNCYTTGKLLHNDCSGGVVGYVYDGSISNCYSTVEVVGNPAGSVAGGIVGGVNGVVGSSISNCYSIGEIHGIGVGSIVGVINAYSSDSVTNCAALSPCVVRNGSILEPPPAAGRVLGQAYSYTLSNNIAFDSMLNKDGNTIWYHKGLDQIDGADISKEFIKTDSTLGGRFTSPVWTTKAGKLPGLFGNTVDMPVHFQDPIPPQITTVSLPNGTVGTAYSATLTADGNTPITWSFEGDTLSKAGLFFTPNGSISGIPVKDGIFYITVKATNVAGSDVKAFSINIGSVGIVGANGIRPEIRIYPNPAKNQLQVTSYELRVTREYGN